MAAEPLDSDPMRSASEIAGTTTSEAPGFSDPASDEPTSDEEAGSRDDPEGVEADGSGPEPARPRRKRKKNKATGFCALTGRELPRRDLFPIDALRPQISERLRVDHPDLPALGNRIYYQISTSLPSH